MREADIVIGPEFWRKAASVDVCRKCSVGGVRDDCLSIRKT
jgi:hypothetical protein